MVSIIEYSEYAHPWGGEETSDCEVASDGSNNLEPWCWLDIAENVPNDTEPKEAGWTLPNARINKASRLTVPMFLCILLSLLPVALGSLPASTVNLSFATTTLPAINIATALPGPASTAPLEPTTNHVCSGLKASDKKGAVAVGGGRGGGARAGVGGAGASRYKNQGGKLQVPGLIRGLVQLVTFGIPSRRQS